LAAQIEGEAIPKIEEAKALAAQFILPDNAMRNWNAYESQVQQVHTDSFAWMVDPQTNGGLLFTFSEESRGDIETLMRDQNQEFWVIGRTKLWEAESPIRVRIV
jgi:selenophosphate synthase